MKAYVRSTVWPLLTLLLLGSLLVVGCSRSATADLLPDIQGQEQDANGGLDLDAQNETMQALLSTGLTETASAPQEEGDTVETPEPQVEPGEEIATEVLSEENTLSSEGETIINPEGEQTTSSDEANLESSESDSTAIVADEGSEILEIVEIEAVEMDGDPETMTGPAFTLPTTYIVQQGDWIYMIAREFNVEPREVISANPGFDPEIVIPGQELLIPDPAPSDGGEQTGAVDELGTAAMVAPTAGETVTETYVVETGDTVFSIGLRHDVSYADLAAANDISSPYMVFPGQVLVIP